MEIRLTVHAPGHLHAATDVVVSWSGHHTAAALCSTLCTHLGVPAKHLLVGGRAVPEGSILGYPPLLDGASVALAPGAPSSPRPGGGRGALEVVAVGGPDAGRSHPLAPPGVDVGRAPASGLRLDDQALSRSHARLSVSAGGVVLEDLGSTNGLTVDATVVDGRTDVDTSSTIGAGSTTLRLRRAAGVGLPVVPRGDGTVTLTPAPAPPATQVEAVVEAPSPPAEPHRMRIPWLAALLPIPVAGVLALVVGPMMLAFALLGPVVLLGSALGDRWGARRSHRRDLAAHAVALAAARDRLERAVVDEVRRRHLQHPDAHAVLQTAEHRLPGLWSGGDLTVRIGLGDVVARTSWVDASGVEHPTAAGVPVIVDLPAADTFGVAGPPKITDGVLAHVVGQLVCRMPPGRLRVSAPAAGSFAWVNRLPHATPCRSATDVVELVVVPDSSRPSAAAGVAAARSRGAVVVAAARSRDALPGGTATVLEVDPSGQHVLTTEGTRTPLVTDVVAPWWPDRLSRALAPVRPVTGTSGPQQLAGTVDLAEAHDVDEISVDQILRAWSAPNRGPRAVVGRSVEGRHVVDLAGDGPHVLVGGTTGSGKSEFLRTLVTGLAMAAPPDELAILLVDFKGGAAFGPCAALPHVVGLVTDLDDHLVERVLTSLGAELRRRERVLADSGASDLDDHHQRQAPGADPLPRLVVVVDELRALVDELPDFVSGLVRLAAQGRSLGIHLVLATQRPAGTITPEIQANVDLRIAFRVRDRTDSVDVVDDPAAAAIPADAPGRAVARGGDGRLVEFQSALVTPGRGPTPPFLDIRNSGDARVHTPPSAPDDRAASTAAVVGIVAEAHDRRGGALPRRPWLPPLPDVVPADQVAPGTVAMVDEPDRQRTGTARWGDSDLWRFVGRPRSGRSSALRSVAVAAVAGMAPDDVHVHVVDGKGSLADLTALPHVGTVVRPHDRPALNALLEYLRAEVEHRLEARRRETLPAPARPDADLVLLVDDWEVLAEVDDHHRAAPVADAVLALLRDGRAVGLVGAVAGGRSLLGPRWSALGGAAYLVGEVDLLDAAVAGVPSGSLPRRPPAGRAVRVGDAREIQVVWHPAIDPAGVPVENGSATSSRARMPWRHRPLPTHLPSSSTPAASGPAAVVIGVGGPVAAPVEWSPDRDGRRLLLAGPPGSGRSSLLLLLARGFGSAGRAVVVVTREPGAWPGQGMTVVEPTQVDLLVDERRRHPGLVVLVDDADRLDDAPIQTVLREIDDLVDRDDGALVVATSSTSLTTRFRGIDVDVAQHRLGVVLRPGPGDGEPLGVRGLSVAQDLPGRGCFVRARTVTEVQVALVGEGDGSGEVAAVVPVGPGRPHAEGGDHRRDGDEHDDAAEHPLAAL